MAMILTISSCGEKENLFVASGYTTENKPDIALCNLGPDGNTEILTQFTCGENPSFFTAGKDGLYYFVNEVDSFNLKRGGGITTLRIDRLKRTVEKVSSINQGGGGPCHIILSDDGGYLITANYGSGSVSVIRLDKDGIPEEVTDVIGYGDKSHPHMILYNSRTRLYYVTDLGLDRVYIFNLDTKIGRLMNAKTQNFKTVEGAGPRHMVIDTPGTNLYVINELNSTISVYDIIPGLPVVKQTLSTLPESFSGENFCADIHLSHDGKILYASNRGHNSIAIFKVARDGKLTMTGNVPCRGDWPRNFALSNDDRNLVVGNRRSNTIAVLKNGKKELSGEPVSSIPFEAPACVKFIE